MTVCVWDSNFPGLDNHVARIGTNTACTHSSTLCNHNLSLSLRLSMALSGVWWWTRTNVNDVGFSISLGEVAESQWIPIPPVWKLSKAAGQRKLFLQFSHSIPWKGLPMLASGTAAIMVDEQPPLKYSDKEVRNPSRVMTWMPEWKWTVLWCAICLYDLVTSIQRIVSVAARSGLHFHATHYLGPTCISKVKSLHCL